MWRTQDHSEKEPASKLYDREGRAPWHRWYGLAAWKHLRNWFLNQAENVVCAIPGCNRPATEVDHKIPHKGNWALFMDRTNLNPLCHKHHSEKTVRENGGFGNAR